MKYSELKIIRSVLRKEIGIIWPYFILRCFIRSRLLFKQSDWKNKEKFEANFAKRIMISVVIYQKLQKNLSQEDAFEIMRKIFVPLGSNEQINNVKALKVECLTPMEQLLAFYGFMSTGGVARTVKRNLISANSKHLHYEVRNCFFYRFYSSMGTPELTKLFCEVDTQFFPQAFPKLNFHRGTSFENTIAYGKDHCTFIFDKEVV